jgi:hypothetical protein
MNKRSPGDIRACLTARCLYDILLSRGDCSSDQFLKAYLEAGGGRNVLQGLFFPDGPLVGDHFFLVQLIMPTLAALLFSPVLLDGSSITTVLSKYFLPICLVYGLYLLISLTGLWYWLSHFFFSALVWATADVRTEDEYSANLTFRVSALLGLIEFAAIYPLVRKNYRLGHYRVAKDLVLLKAVRATCDSVIFGLRFGILKLVLAPPLVLSLYLLCKSLKHRRAGIYSTVFMFVVYLYIWNAFECYLGFVSRIHAYIQEM